MSPIVPVLLVDPPHESVALYRNREECGMNRKIKNTDQGPYFIRNNGNLEIHLQCSRISLRNGNAKKIRDREEKNDNI